MIIGIGTDLLEIGRIREILDSDAAERFMRRVLTAEEREQAEQRKGRLYEFVAGRFAAKEAAAKALGCGIGSVLSFQDIEIGYEPGGKPLCRISPSSLERLDLPPDIRIHLSITHTADMAAAYVILETIANGESTV